MEINQERKEEMSEDSVRREIDVLSVTLETLRQRCSQARCNLILNPNGWIPQSSHSSPSLISLELRSRRTPFTEQFNLDEELKSIQFRNDELKKQRDALQGQISSITEENGDVYDTLQLLTIQKEEGKAKLDEAEDELDTCNRVAHFLEQERNHLKQEIERQDETLDHYRSIYSSAFKPSK